MADRKPANALSLVVAIAALSLVPWNVVMAGAEEAPELLKGTVVELNEGVLTLKDVRFADETIPPRVVKIRADKETAFYDGPMQVTKEAIVADLLVLVRCTLVGSERKAILVRIIGGKKS